MRQAIASSALWIVFSHASAEVLELPCRASIGDDDPTDFVIAIDVSAAAITEGDVRWTTTDPEATIDWSLDFQDNRDVLRGVILTGAHAGLMIAGECIATLRPSE